MVIKNARLIGTKPGGTSPVIAGTRIRVCHIVRIRREFETDAEAVAQAVREMPHLTPDGVQAAIDYWRNHTEEIEAEIRDEDELFRQIEENPPPWIRVVRY